MFYTFAKWVLWFLFRLIYRVRITGRENIPKEGAFLLWLSMFLKREPRFMAKKELFKPGLYNWFFKNYGAYPIDRHATADMQAFRTTLDLLKNENGIIIFSQGTRMKDFENAKGGVAVFALKSGAPIIPAGILRRTDSHGRIRRTKS
jgi:1-acyl-sn-glycerol-3-phosphate acyltransferase